MFGNALNSTILIECPTGYLFKPYGELGRTFIVARSSARWIVWGTMAFSFSALPLIAIIIAAGVLSRTTHSPLAFLISAGFGLIWMIAYWLWATIVTRGHISMPRKGSGDVDAR